MGVGEFGLWGLLLVWDSFWVWGILFFYSYYKNGICRCLIECLIEAIRVTYQIPAGWMTGFAELVVGGENDEDFGCHFGGLVVFRMSIELN